MVHCLSTRILEAASAHWAQGRGPVPTEAGQGAHGACEVPGAAEFSPWFREAHDCFFM